MFSLHLFLLLLARFFWAICLVFVAALPASAQRTLVSGAMPPGGDVTNFQLSPNGQYAVFLADKDVDNRFELYSANLSTGAIVRLAGSIVADGQVLEYKISPDSTRVVFRGVVETAGAMELFSAPIAAADSRVKLSGSRVPGGAVNPDFAISPDSARVVFKGDLLTDGQIELFSAPIAAADSRVVLSADVVAGGNVSGEPKISPDSAYVVFSGDLKENGVLELYRAPIATEQRRTTLSGTVAAGGGVAGMYEISPDSAYVVFIGDVASSGVFELWSTPLSGEPVRVALSGSVAGLVEEFRISPDSTRVVFRGSVEAAVVNEIFSAPIGTPGGRIKISGTAANGGDAGLFEISPDSTRVVFAGDVATNGVMELFSAPIATANNRVPLSGTATTGGTIDQLYFRISPDSTRVVFRGTLADPAVMELFSAPIATANSRVALSGASVSGSSVMNNFQISPDSARVVFRGNLRNGSDTDVFSAPIASANGRATLSGAMVANGGVFEFRITPDSSRVIFRGDLVTDQVFELFKVNANYVALNLDFDGDGLVLGHTDSLMMTRYLLGVRGVALTANALGANATITAPEVIETRIQAVLSQAVP